MPIQPSRVSALDDIGDPDAPPGSLPWTKWMIGQAKLRRQELKRDVAGLQKIIVKLQGNAAWKALGFLSLGALCSAELDLDEEQVNLILKANPGTTLGTVLKAQPAKVGRPPKLVESTNLSQADRACSNGVGMNTQRYLDRLARDYPDLLEKVKAGELKPYAAARQAGIVKVLTPVETAQKAFAKLSRAEREQFLAWTTEQE